MAGSYRLIDALIGMPAPPRKEARKLDPNIARWFKGSKQMTEGATLEDMVTDMDAGDVEFAHLTAAIMGRAGNPAYGVGQDIPDQLFEALCRRAAEVLQRFPGRFKSSIGLDPSRVMTAVRRLEKAVLEYGFSGAYIMPSMIGLPPNHPSYFPIYAKCVELGLPIKINVGVPGPMRPALLQYPMHLDEVLLAFPELTVIGVHLGHPWQREVIALLQKYPNFYLVTSAWAPKHIPQELWDFANTSRGIHKMMWATDYPLLPIERCVREGWQVPLKEEAKRRYLRDNALEVFGFR
ncbi:MAG: amidohydrolase family protein [Candidatus Binataceae bacterium]